MTHDRGGPAVIGTGALIVLIADLLYASSHWSGSFPRSFLVSFVALAVVSSTAFAGSTGPHGDPCRSARSSGRRGMNIVFVVVIVAFIEVSTRVGGNSAGGIVGMLAGLAGGFALYTAVWLARRRS